MKKPHILVLTCMYSRPVISRAWCVQMNRLKKKYKDIFNITVVAGVSEDLSAQICAEEGVQFNWFDNFPLSNKWNLALDFAIYNNPDYDYLLILGDDDFIHDNLLLEYIPFIENRIAHFGIQSTYLYGAEVGRAIYFRYDDNRLMGAGRMVSKGLVDQIRGDHPEPEVGLWQSGLNRGLDRSLENRCAVFAIAMPVVTKEVYLTDVKTKQNLWPFEKFEGMGDEVSAETALANIGKKELEIIQSYYNK